ncbi:MAG: LCP family protein [Solobacterium sp.]|nr:LCP family protein [Solobacterium sp.]
MAKRRKRVLRKKDAQKALIAISILFFLIAVGGYFISRWENRKYTIEGGESTVEVETFDARPKEFTWNGVDYVDNKKVHSYLMMGSDTYDDNESPDTSGSRADAQFLLVVDDLNQTWRILLLDRDSFVSVDAYSEDGKKYIETTNMHLTLAHIFGDWNFGARNTVKAVSRMLWNQPIDGFFDMNMSAISILNDMVGGVPVTITTDFTSVDDSLPLGEEVVLMGDQAEHFVRARMTVDDGTNEARMARQEAYLKSLINKMAGLSQDEILDIYDSLMSNSITNMGSKTFLDLADIMNNYTQLDDIRIQGTHVVEDEGYMFFYLDEDSLTEVILELFYVEKN